MEKINCLRCNFRHTDNGDCTAVGGFCTAVPAAHCPLLREYLDTGLEPEAVETVKLALAAKHLVDLETLNNTPISRIVELAEADKDGRVVVLPCNGYSDIEIVKNGISYKPAHWDIHLTTFAHGQNTPSGIKVGLFDIGEVERALQEME